MATTIDDDLEVYRHFKLALDPALKAYQQAAAQLEGKETVDNVTGYISAADVLCKAVAGLMELLAKHPEYFKAGFDIERLKKMMEELE
jgi:hypothetical protein